MLIHSRYLVPIVAFIFILADGSQHLPFVSVVAAAFQFRPTKVKQQPSYNLLGLLSRGEHVQPHGQINNPLSNYRSLQRSMSQATCASEGGTRPLTLDNTSLFSFFGQWTVLPTTHVHFRPESYCGDSATYITYHFPCIWNLTRMVYLIFVWFGEEIWYSKPFLGAGLN